MLKRIAPFCALALLVSMGPIVKADTLHGFCWGTSTCSDNGSNTPTTSHDPDFGFAGSGQSVSGNLLIEILVPQNEDLSPASLGITVDDTSASTNFAASLVSSTDWASGDLDSYLGLSASPNNPIGAYLDSSETFLDSGATGFYVYQASLGAQTLGGTSNPSTGPLLTLGAPLPEGTYIVAFLDSGGNKDGATANSGAILLDTPLPPTVTPEPSSLMLLGTGIVGAAGVLRRRLRGRGAE